MLLFGDASESLLYEEVDSVYMQHLFVEQIFIIISGISRQKILQENLMCSFHLLSDMNVQEKSLQWEVT